jgi:hypothetical protein
MPTQNALALQARSARSADRQTGGLSDYRLADSGTPGLSGSPTLRLLNQGGLDCEKEDLWGKGPRC